jgi:hypothetical protein
LIYQTGCCFLIKKIGLFAFYQRLKVNGVICSVTINGIDCLNKEQWTHGRLHQNDAGTA